MKLSSTRLNAPQGEDADTGEFKRVPFVDFACAKERGNQFGIGKYNL